MATSENNISFYCDTNTLIRAYCAFLKAQMLAMGWLQTSDTGQLDPTTVVIPTGLDQDLGYMMFKMNDSLQATNPVFVKLTIGSISSSSVGDAMSGGQSYYVIRIKVQVGTATSGAGVFTGFKISQERRMTYYSLSSAPISNTPATAASGDLHLFCGDINRILMMRGINGPMVSTVEPFNSSVTPPSSQNGFRSQSYWSIERSKDSAGLDTNDGIIFVASANMGENTGSNGQYFHEYIPFSRPLPQHRHQRWWPMLCLGDPNYITALNYNQLTGFPLIPFEGGQMKNPGMNQLGYWVNDFQYGGTTTPIVIYAATHQYRPITQDAFRPLLGSVPGMNASSRLMIRWE